MILPKNSNATVEPWSWLIYRTPARNWRGRVDYRVLATKLLGTKVFVGQCPPLVAKCGIAATGTRASNDGTRELTDWNLTTARTLIRPAITADAAALHRSRGEMPFDPQTRSVADTLGLIAAMDRRPAPDAAGWQQFAVLARDDGRFLGDIGVNFDTPRNEQAEIGFAFAVAARAQGFASEAVGAMVDRLFASGRHRLIAQTDGRNMAAQRLLQALHFRREAVHLASWKEAGQWFDEFVYARLSHEHRP